MKSLALLALLSMAGCFGYAVRKAEGPARDVPAKLFGAGPGAYTPGDLIEAGWALAEETTRGQLYVLATADDEVREAEAWLTRNEKMEPTVEFVRLRYRSTRLATYEALLASLQEQHGPPQVSEERPGSPLLWIDPESDRPRPARVVVHRWRGHEADLVLVAGLEAKENLRTAMDYQLLLVLPGSAD